MKLVMVGALHTTKSNQGKTKLDQNLRAKNSVDMKDKTTSQHTR